MCNVEAVIFDMDGVLVDSEPFIAQAAMNMFNEKYNVVVKESDFKPFVGAGEDRYIGGVAGKYGISLTMPDDKNKTYEIYCRIIKGSLKELPGASRFIEQCNHRGLKTALATSADEVKMKANLEEIGIPLSDFNAVVNGLDVEKKKPHPDIYIEAAHRINTLPSCCLIVEDAVNGVMAAKEAGAKCLGLTSAFSSEELKKAGADFIAKDLEHVEVDELLKSF